MPINYIPDEASLELDPSLSAFTLDPKSFLKISETAAGQQILAFLTSRFGVALIIGSVSAAPKKPPVLATEEWIYRLVGAEAFDDEAKQFTGLVMRQVVEALGGDFVRNGQKCTEGSRYKKGSIYRFT